MLAGSPITKAGEFQRHGSELIKFLQSWRTCLSLTNSRFWSRIWRRVGPVGSGKFDFTARKISVRQSPLSRSMNGSFLRFYVSMLVMAKVFEDDAHA